MPRTRDQFTGHVWIRSLDRDQKAYHSAVLEIRPVQENLDFLTSMRYLCLAQKRGDQYGLTVYPRLDFPPPPMGRFAARYLGVSLAEVFQAASNDYHALLSGSARANVTVTQALRGVQVIEKGDK